MPHARSSRRQATALHGAAAAPLADAAFKPELCKPVQAPPAGDRWLHETKWDGYRLLATVVHGKARLWSRNAIEWSDRVPELVEAIESLGLDSAQLDGEMVVLRGGRSDFNALQGRLSAESRVEPTYMLFDLPYLDGRSLRHVPLIERKAALEQILRRHPHPRLRYSAHGVGHAAEAFAEAIAQGREGIVCKRAESHYVGARNGDWIKVKGRPSDEFAVVGFTEPKGSRAGIGALLLALPVDGELKYVGRVGTGMNDTQLRELRRELQPDVVDDPPADIAPMARKDRTLAIWVRPRLVVEVFHQGIGSQGLLRQPAFKSLRADKTPHDLGRFKANKRPVHAATRKPGASRSSRRTVTIDGVAITHPDRGVFPKYGTTKADVAAYYRGVARWIVPEIAGRPLSLLRCPDGIDEACFFQKHLAGKLGAHVHGIDIRDSSGMQEYLRIDDEAGLLELVQMNTIEFHPWSAKADQPDRADRVIFDLDPHAGVAFRRVTAGARALRRKLESLGLKSFVRTSGGKGLHVVVPLNPPEKWDRVRRFARAIAEAMVRAQPDDFVATAGEAKRENRIFIDWLRNARGATSVASYSLRARPDGGVALPLAWPQLARLKTAKQYTVANALRHIGQRRGDPWKDIGKVVQSLPEGDVSPVSR